MAITIYSNDNIIDWNATGKDRIIQNVRNILRTRQHEVPFMRDMGINIDLLDSHSQAIKSVIEEHITELIKTYEDRANVLEVRLESCDENGNYIIAVDLEV